MTSKAIGGTLRDVWARRNMPKQLRARDTRLAFTDIIVRFVYAFWLRGSGANG